MLGLGVAAGAVLQQPLQAQVRDTTRARRDSAGKRDTTSNVPPRAKGDSSRIAVPVPPHADSLLPDSLRKRDSTKGPAVPLPAVPKDTIKAPIAHAYAPPLLDVGGSYVWDRTSLFATGAVTAQDLLDRVPGATGFRAGWLAAPMTTAYLGDVGRVRIFYDGLELDNLDPRSGGAIDLTQIQIWTLEEVRIERSASELRVYLRSWRVDRTTASTRTDVSTGDQQTNMYRGFFGRRYAHGEDLQVGAQQYGTTPGITGASSDQTALMGRVGWARAGWSIDGFMLRTSRHRGAIYSLNEQPDSLSGVESTRTDAYLRAAFGDPDSGPWLQAIAGTEGYKYTGQVQADTTKKISADTSLTQPQYVLTGGFTRWGLQLSGAERVRYFRGARLSTPSARASYVTRLLAVSAYSEGRSADSISRSEVSVRLSPLSFVSLVGAAGCTTDQRVLSWRVLLPLRDTSVTSKYSRAEVGLRVRGLWLSGGVLRRDAVLLTAPRLFDTVLTRRVDPAATATFASVRGRLYEDLYADVTAMRWGDTAGFYRPRYQTRSEVGIRTSWLRRFPSGDFGLHFAVTHDYRSNTYFPTDTGAVIVPGFRTISMLLEVRILSGVVFFQMRNVLGERYALVPNWTMPRQTSLYGMRWDFWN